METSTELKDTTPPHGVTPDSQRGEHRRGRIGGPLADHDQRPGARGAADMTYWPGIGASRYRQELDSHLAYRGPVPISSTTRLLAGIVTSRRTACGGPRPARLVR